MADVRCKPLERPTETREANGTTRVLARAAVAIDRKVRTRRKLMR